MTRLAVALGRLPDGSGLGVLLAGALGDPDLRLGYPVGPAGRVVDADGRPVVLGPGRRVTPIVGDAGVVALVESDATGADALERALGPASRLALGNERLRAEALVRLADATRVAGARRRDRGCRAAADGARSPRRRAAADARARLRPPRRARARGGGPRPEAAAPLREALGRALAASEELREIAHGVFPVELTASGLEAALESLADVRPLRLDCRLAPGRRFRAEVETAAYAVVVEALDAGGGA